MENKPWLAYYPPQIPAHLNYPQVPLTHFLEEASEHHPDKQALSFLGKKIDYRDLAKEVKKFAGILRQLGVKKGDRVAIMLPNCPQAVFCYYGALWIGAIVVQTNPLYMERELIFQLNNAEVETIVCLDLVYPKVREAKAKTRLKNVIVTRMEDYLPFPKNLLYPLVQKRKGLYPAIDFLGEECLSLKNLMKDAEEFVEPAQINPKTDLALLQYTGGTTGRAKGVMLTHENLVANVIQCNAWFYKSEAGEERFLGAVPFFHVYGMTVAMNLSIRMAGTLVMVPKFDVDLLLKTITKEKPTVFPGAPTMYIALINHPHLSKYDLSSIDACISGSAPLPMEVQESFEELTKGRLVEGYGLTECSPVTHANPIWDHRVTGSIGLPWPDTEAKIVDLKTDEPIPPGEIGELIVRGPQVMKGYWKNPEETRLVLREGWLYTGDLAYMDEKGYFYIVDRKKDMIIAGGFNIYPREVEEVLYEHKAVSEAAVVGVPDPYRGETVKAFIVVKKGAAVSEQELNIFCRERLAAYKVPRLYEFRSELPKTMVGKVLKKDLIQGVDQDPT